jgi:hypothetical protein
VRKSHTVPGLSAALDAAGIMPDVNAETAMPNADAETATSSTALHALDAAPSSVRELTRLKQLGFSFTQEAETMCREKEATAAAVRQELQSAAAASPVTGALVARLQALETAVLRAKTAAEFVRIKKQVCVIFGRPGVWFGLRPSSSVLPTEPDCRRVVACASYLTISRHTQVIANKTKHLPSSSSSSSSSSSAPEVALAVGVGPVRRMVALVCRSKCVGLDSLTRFDYAG